MQIQSDDEQSYHTCFSQVQEETSVLAQRTFTEEEGQSPQLNRRSRIFRAMAIFLTVPHLETIYPDSRDWGALRLKKWLTDFCTSIDRQPIAIRVALEQHQDNSPHLHVAAIFNKSLYIRNVEDWCTRHIGKPSNLQPLKDPEASFLYLEKGGNYVTQGELPRKVKTPPKKEERINIISNIVSIKGSIKQLLEADSNNLLESRKAYENLNLLKQIYHPPQDNPRPCGLYVEGPPGTGKSFLCREAIKLAGYSILDDVEFVVPATKFLSTNVANHPIWIIDDFDQSWIKSGNYTFQQLKLILDQYTFQCEFKGGMCKVRPILIIITSNYSLTELFIGSQIAELDPLRHAITRRFFDQIILSKDYQSEEGRCPRREADNLMKTIVDFLKK